MNQGPSKAGTKELKAGILKVEPRSRNLGLVSEMRLTTQDRIGGAHDPRPRTLVLDLKDKTLVKGGTQDPE